MEITFEFGQEVYDEVTWFSWKVTGKATYQHSQDKYLVEKMLDNGSLESVWFDKQRLLSEPQQNQ